MEIMTITAIIEKLATIVNRKRYGNYEYYGNYEKTGNYSK